MEEAFKESRVTNAHFPASLIEIGDGCFADTEVLIHVSFEPGSQCDSIGRRAFFNSAIPFIAIPASVTAIQDECFRRCKSLGSITIVPDGSLYWIGDEAFLGSGLRTFQAPINLGYLGNNCFSSCSDLGKIGFGTTILLRELRYSALCLLPKLEEFSFPPNLETIEEKCFLGCHLTVLDFPRPSRLTVIGAMAFCGGNLMNVTIPGSVVLINPKSFARCKNLERLVFEDGEEPLFLSRKAFTKTTLKTVNFPIRPVNVGEGCFKHCTQLGEVTFSEDSESITLGNGAFFDSGLRSLYLPGGIQFLGEKCFKKCGKLFKIAFGETFLVPFFSRELFANSGLQDVRIPLGTETIGQGCFQDCSNLWSVGLPPDLLRIEADAFRGVPARLKLPASIMGFSMMCCGSEIESKKHIKHLDRLHDRIFPDTVVLGPQDDSLFVGGVMRQTGARELVIADGVDHIESGAFRKAIHLQKLVIRDGARIENFGVGVFGKTGLRTLDLNSDGITATGSEAFVLCKSLRSIRFRPGSRIRKISDCSFNRNYSLKQVEIPKSVKVVGDWAFASCLSLSRVTFEAESRLKNIGFKAFWKTAIKEISFPSSLDALRSDAFKDCKRLRRVKFNPGPLTRLRIDWNVFDGTDLQVLIVPKRTEIHLNSGGSNTSGNKIPILFSPRWATDTILR
jgi:hypothetical protein